MMKIAATVNSKVVIVLHNQNAALILTNPPETKDIFVDFGDKRGMWKNYGLCERIGLWLLGIRLER